MLDAIAMMDDFISPEWAPDSLLHDPAVLGVVAFPGSRRDEYVSASGQPTRAPISTTSAAALPLSVTSDRAEFLVDMVRSLIADQETFTMRAVLRTTPYPVHRG